MTIAKRLLVLLAVPVFALLALGLFTRLQLSRIEGQSRFVAESRVEALVTLGSLSRSFSEVRIAVRSHLLATNEAQRAVARGDFTRYQQEVSRLLQKYADGLVVTKQGGQLLSQYRTLSTEWLAGAKEAMLLADQGRQADAAALLDGRLAEVAHRLNLTASEWVRNNEELAGNAGKDSLAGIERARRNITIVNSASLILIGLLGFRTFRRIVQPIQGLDVSVKAIAAGDYAKATPFTGGTDETGSLARSIEVLKQSAMAMDEQRWIKASANSITADLQGAATLQEFGQRFVSRLVPFLGGGVAGFYVYEDNSGQLKRFAAYGLADGADTARTLRVGEGLPGQCARDRKRVALTHLPPGYLRIASGLGVANPTQAFAVPLLCQDVLVGVVELASFRSLQSREEGLLREVLPMVALNLEILQRNLRTLELLAYTQEQARQLEEQTEELTQSQEELTAQQRELTTQREYLRESEERSRLILDSTAEGIFGTDLEGKVTFVNPAACQMLGYSAAELIGQPSHATFHQYHADGRDYPQQDCPMYAAFKQGKASRIDNEFLWRKDGTGFPVEYGATPIWKDGALVGSVVSFTDITDRVLAQDRARDQAGFLQALIDTLPYPVFYRDPDTRFLGCNRAYEQAFGIQREALVGKRVLELEFLPEADRRAFQAEDEAIVASAGSVEKEIAIPMVDGRVHDVLYSVRGFRRPDGSPGGLIGTMVDVSGRRKERVADRLAALLCEFDPGAVDFVRSNQSALRPLFPGENWRQFTNLVENFAFAEALARLNQTTQHAPPP